MRLPDRTSRVAAGLTALAAILALAAATAIGRSPEPAARAAGRRAAPVQSITDPTTGAVFTIQSSTSRLTLRAVTFVDTEHGWIVGGEGERDEKPVVLRTEDGGATWLAVGDIPDLLRLEDVWFNDRSTGWMVGVRGLVYRSGDGGRTWQRQESGVTAKLSTVQFVDDRIGWIGEAAKPAVLKTTDGGASWRRIAIPDVDDESGLSNLYFLDAQRGWALGADGVLVATTDGGETWDDIGYGIDNRMYGLFFWDALTGWVAASQIRKTTDGGQTWTTQPRPPKSLEEIVFVTPDVGWAVGDEGLFYHTRDGGQTWVREVERFTRAALRDLAIVGGQHLWAVGTNGTIVHRYDPAYATATPVSTATPIPTATPVPTATLTPTPVGPWLRAGDPTRPIYVPLGGRHAVEVRFGNMPAGADVLEVIVEGSATLSDGTQAAAVDVSAAGGNGTAVVTLMAAEGASVGDAFTLRLALGGVAVPVPGIVAAAVTFPTAFR